MIDPIGICAGILVGSAVCHGLQLRKLKAIREASEAQSSAIFALQTAQDVLTYHQERVALAIAATATAEQIRGLTALVVENMGAIMVESPRKARSDKGAKRAPKAPKIVINPSPIPYTVVESQTEATP